MIVRFIGMRWSILVLAACSSGAERAPAADPPGAPPATNDGPDEVVADREPIATTGSHAGTIAVISVTADGGAVATADEAGAMRLWPTLDGTREPIVVHGPPPRAFAVGREGDGLVVAILDAAHAATWVRFDPSGMERSRISVPREPAVEQLELVDGRVALLRADQRIEIYALDGARHAELGAEPGARIVRLVTGGSHLVAIEVDGTRAYARPISLDEPVPRWANRVRVRADPAGPLGLSPDGRKLIGIRRDQLGRPVLTDLGTGVSRQDLCEGRTLEPDDEELELGDDAFLGLREAMMPRTVGFIDDTTVACVIAGKIVWSRLDGKTSRATVDDDTALEVAHGRVIGRVGVQLVLYRTPSVDQTGELATPNVQYLGYAVRELSHLRTGPTGLVLGQGDQIPVLVDDRFRERARYPLPKTEGVVWADVVPLDDRRVLAVSERTASPQDLWATAYRLAIYDVKAGTMQQELPVLPHEPQVTYDGTTRLLATSDGQTPMLLRLDPTTGTFVDRFTIQAPPRSEVRLLDPALAGGLIALTISPTAIGPIEIREYHGADLRSGAIAPRRTYRVAGQLQAVDRTGRVVVATADFSALQVYAHGVLFATIDGLPSSTSVIVHPSPDGQELAVIVEGTIRLYTIDGTLRWQAAHWQAKDYDWTAGGTLFARFGSGLASLDRATGAMIDRQCGWRFGLGPEPWPSGGHLPNICDVAP